MANVYGTYYNPTQNYGSAQLDDGVSHVQIPGRLGGRIRYKVAKYVGVPTDAADVIRLCQMKSSDIILSIRITVLAGNWTGTHNLGFHQIAEASGVGGAEVDKDCILTASTFYASQRKGQTVNDGTNGVVDTTQVQLGETNWQRAGLSADPSETWDLTVTGSAFSGTSDTIVHEIQYIAT